MAGAAMPELLVLGAGVEPIPGYKLVRLLGRGGFGEVWEASAPGDFHVALKFIRLDTDEAGVEQRSLDVIRHIRHPHLLDVQFATRVADCLIIAMPLCDESLMDRLRASPRGLPPDELLVYMDELARAVDYLNEPNHRASDGKLVGVQHRDIKPHNIFLVGGSVRLADFGLAKILAATSVSHTGSMSPHYVAPEVAEGRVSQRSDQYALAVTYHHLRTGKLPFQGESVLQIIYAHILGEPDLSGLPEHERPVVARALARRPEDRWPSCRAFVRALVASGSAPAAGGATRLPETGPLLPIAPTTGVAWRAPAPEEPPKQITSSIGVKLVLIPAGEFLMGSPDSDGDAQDDEKPQHQVRITRPFYLGTTEVTQGQYRAITGESPSNFKGSHDLPVEEVSWNDAIAFCNKLSEREGLKPYYQLGAGAPSGGEGYRLPTEAEWEYACRAGTATRFSFGDADTSLGESAWFSDNSDFKTHPVGQKRPNAWGLFDMHGNVWEWCGDGYAADCYQGSPAAADPPGPSQSADRVIRGGGWNDFPQDCRAALRGWFAPGYRGSSLGFRLARGQSSR
jgi:formylglycine-generating enzyme required for sulfatase activity